MDQVTVTQPGRIGDASIVLKDGPVTVRNLQDTPEDTSFAGTLIVEGFRDKYVHATGEESIEKCYRVLSKEHQGHPSEFYERTFVAEYEGKKVGIMTLAYHGDPKPSLNSEDLTEFGCCSSFRLTSLFDFTKASAEIPPNYCYLDHICVDASVRGKGIGKILLNLADSEGRRKNCTDIFLWATSTNRALNLYKRHGYEIVEESSCCWDCCLWCTMGERSFVKMVKHL